MSTWIINSKFELNLICKFTETPFQSDKEIESLTAERSQSLLTGQWPA